MSRGDRPVAVAELGSGSGKKTRKILEALAKHGRRIYAELGMNLVIGDVAEGGGTDAAFAALKTKAPVIERFGLRGFGSHSNDAEYVEIDSIEPRLYLLTRMIMDVSRGKQE